MSLIRARRPYSKAAFEMVEAKEDGGATIAPLAMTPSRAQLMEEWPDERNVLLTALGLVPSMNDPVQYLWGMALPV